MHLGENIKYGGDAISAALAVATLAQWLPALAALLSIVWTGIRIFETRTVQSLLGRVDPEREAGE
jgi:hypothetical protein